MSIHSPYSYRSHRLTVTVPYGYPRTVVINYCTTAPYRSTEPRLRSPKGTSSSEEDDKSRTAPTHQKNWKYRIAKNIARKSFLPLRAARSRRRPIVQLHARICKHLYSSAARTAEWQTGSGATVLVARCRSTVAMSRSYLYRVPDAVPYRTVSLLYRSARLVNVPAASCRPVIFFRLLLRNMTDSIRNTDLLTKSALISEYSQDRQTSKHPNRRGSFN